VKRFERGFVQGEVKTASKPQDMSITDKTGKREKKEEDETGKKITPNPHFPPPTDLEQKQGK